MKNVIYGMGSYFLNNLQLWTEVLKDTVAFCDSDKRIREKYGSILGLPIIQPEQIFDMIGEDRRVFVTSGWNYEEIFRDLTVKYNVPARCIAWLQVPNEELLMKVQDFTGAFAYGPAVEINDDAFENAVLLPNRTTALKYMPKNAICTEIGVAYGDFSKQILDIMQPSKFYAIDLFSEIHPYTCNRDDFERDNMTHKAWYENRFKNEIANGLIKTRQGLSWGKLAEFPDDYFDYAYLDAAHDYESVMKDLRVLPGKVKDGGFIQFNDYSLKDSTRLSMWGVVSAVNQFINSGKHKIRYFCLQCRGYNDIVVQVYKS